MQPVTSRSFFKNYGSILLLLCGVTIGCIAGLIFGSRIAVIKPVGDIFLNLLFTAVVPLVFFTISSSLAGISHSQKFGRLMMIMFAVFVGTVMVAAAVAIAGVSLFPIGEIKTSGAFAQAEQNEPVAVGTQITKTLTADNVYELFSRKSMLALIFFALLTGFAVLRAGDKGRPFLHFLQSGSEVFTQFLKIIMKVAPVGLGAYFATQVGVLGPQLLGSYARALGIFHGISIFYFFVFFSLYAFLAGGFKAVKAYWRNNIAPSATAIGTCSSIATIPVNLQASGQMKILAYIGNIVVPVGATLHKDGSAISSIIKIAAVFALFHRSFTGADVLIIALLISVVVSMVEGGIPAGGYLGELLVMSVYNFPPEAFPVVVIIGTLVDRVATVLNVTCDTAAGMLISRVVAGKRWMGENVVKSGRSASL